MNHNVFCFNCTHCDWVHINKNLKGLSGASSKYDGYCPKCGHKTITYVEFENALWQFDEKNGAWAKAEDQSILKQMKELAT